MKKALREKIAGIGGKPVFLGFRGIVCPKQRGTKTGIESREKRKESREGGKGQFVHNLRFLGVFRAGCPRGRQRRGRGGRIDLPKKGVVLCDFRLVF
jgi:hypothetical protein